VGWQAQESDGLGVAVTDGKMLKGLFKANGGFPNDGRSYASPASSEFTSKDFDTLYYRK
jgi:hypothetical protein